MIESTKTTTITEEDSRENNRYDWIDDFEESENPKEVRAEPIEIKIKCDSVKIPRKRYEQLVKNEALLEAVLRTIACGESYHIEDTVKYIVGDMFPAQKESEEKNELKSE